jgi:predicted nucleic acid-binding protein
VFLLDTNIVSELRRPRPHGAVVAWLQSVPDSELFLSAISMGEIQAGIERTLATDPARAAALDIWADQIVSVYEVVPVTADIFRLWARLMHGRSDSEYEDTMIAASATVHGLTMVTRNVRDLERFDLLVLKPFEFRIG